MINSVGGVCELTCGCVRADVWQSTGGGKPSSSSVTRYGSADRVVSTWPDVEPPGLSPQQRVSAQASRPCSPCLQPLYGFPAGSCLSGPVQSLTCPGGRIAPRSPSGGSWPWAPAPEATQEGRTWRACLAYLRLRLRCVSVCGCGCGMCMYVQTTTPKPALCVRVCVCAPRSTSVEEWISEEDTKGMDGTHSAWQLGSRRDSHRPAPTVNQGTHTHTHTHRLHTDYTHTHTCVSSLTTSSAMISMGLLAAGVPVSSTARLADCTMGITILVRWADML